LPDNLLAKVADVQAVDVCLHLHVYANRADSRDRQRLPTQRQQPQGQSGQEKEHSFLDGICSAFLNLTVDDLPIIRDNIKKGWSTLVGKVKSKLEGEPEPPLPSSHSGEYGYARQQSTRYDADPRVLGDDFSHLNIQDPNRRPSQGQSHRPLANPNLFTTTTFSNNEANENAHPPPKPPRPETQNPSLPAQSSIQNIGGPSPSKKWEPLRPAEDRDPFAVGDSDDEEGKDDLYGTVSDRPTYPPTRTQETGAVSTPLDPAVGTSTKGN